jgi:hypothetical protein
MPETVTSILIDAASDEDLQTMGFSHRDIQLIRSIRKESKERDV